LDKFNKDKSKKDSLCSSCKGCQKELIKNRDYKLIYANNKEKMKESHENWRKVNQEKVNEYWRKRYKNEEQLRVQKQNYRKENIEVIRVYRRKYFKERKENDVSFKISCLLRSRVNAAIKRSKNFKFGKMKTLLGCSLKELKRHLQKTALINGYNDFDINKYNSSDYHIDHIVPCISFDLSKEDEQRKCFHWSNLQILRAEDNLIKGGRII